jgi:hypothetical protein
VPHADLDRGGRADAVELEAPTHPARVAEPPLSGALVHQVEVRVGMDQGDRALDGVVHAAHDGIEERVLAADDDRHAPGSNARPDGVRTRIDRCDQIVRDHGDVTPVDHELLRHADETLAVHVVVRPSCTRIHIHSSDSRIRGGAYRAPGHPSVAPPSNGAPHKSNARGTRGWYRACRSSRAIGW